MQERAAVEMALAEEVLRSYGRLRIMARGSSMVPTIFPGDVLLVERNPDLRVRPGQIVLALRDGRFFAHRVARLTALGGPPRVITRGDALREDDPAFLHDEILGRVMAVVRGRKRIDLDNEGDPYCKRFLRSVIRNSDAIVAGLLWFRARLNGAMRPARTVSTQLPAKLAECS
jgi:Peptidase S24-like